MVPKSLPCLAGSTPKKLTLDTEGRALALPFFLAKIFEASYLLWGALACDGRVARAGYQPSFLYYWPEIAQSIPMPKQCRLGIYKGETYAKLQYQSG